MSIGFFPPDYFGSTGLCAASGSSVIVTVDPNPTPSPDVQLTDALCLAWIKETLEASGLFGWTGIGKVPTIQTNEDYPSAWIYPVAFAELDDVDPEVQTRKLTFCIQILTSPEDYGDDLVNITDLDSISNATANLIAVGPPGSLPGWSRIESGKYDVIPIGTKDKPAVGTQCSGIYLYGTISYFVPGPSGRDDSDPYA